MDASVRIIFTLGALALAPIAIIFMALVGAALAIKASLDFVYFTWTDL